MAVTLKLIEKKTFDINLKIKLKERDKNNLNKTNNNRMNQKAKILTGD